MIKYCKQVAEPLKGKVHGNKNNVPQFKEGFVISENETSRAFEHAKNNEASKAVMEIHTSRGQYNFDENDPLFERAETIQKDTEKVLREVESIDEGGTNYTIEYCDECSDEEYFVKARRNKKRYVYLDKPPYITASNYCENHKTLSVRVEIPNEPEEIFREGGLFESIEFLGKSQKDTRVRCNFGCKIQSKRIRNYPTKNWWNKVFADTYPWLHGQCPKIRKWINIGKARKCEARRDRR